jgi:hypothetical protein
MTANTGNLVPEIMRICNAPPARIFDAWLNREQWQAWGLPAVADRDRHGKDWNSTLNELAAFLARAQVDDGA